MSEHDNCSCQKTKGLALRAATPTDAVLLCDFVRELAEFEGLSHECAVTPEAMAEFVLGPRRCAAAIIAELDGAPAGFALYYRTFSTFAAKPGIYLEDLYVRPDFRKRGIGRALLAAVAEIAHGRSAGRLEWTALKWNSKALALYAAVGAKPMEEWTLLRMAPDAISKLAGPHKTAPHEGCRCGGKGPHHAHS
ncbi:MAG TPA: GNAT family N-acetyltransferase [Opitutaceae bacterium]|nr:GNAT family N-acetyltransferase [Opitutaceae bacterium]